MMQLGRLISEPVVEYPPQPQRGLDHVTKLEDHWAQTALLDETQSVNSKMSKPQKDGEPTVHSTPWADVDPTEKPDFSFITRGTYAYI